jgi:hypothetical protein
MPATATRPPSSEQVAAFDRNAWPRSIGIPGRNRRNPHAGVAAARKRQKIGTYGDNESENNSAHSSPSRSIEAEVVATPASLMASQASTVLMRRGSRHE